MKAPPVRRACRLSAASLLALSALATSSGASQLRIDGAAQAQVPYGDSFRLELSGRPLAPALVLVDVSPGPVTLFGEQVPIGFTPDLYVLWGTVLGADGTGSVAYPIPDLPKYAGKSVYLLGVVADDNDPNGLDFSNGARLDCVPPVGAGATQSIFVGDTAVLDGSDAADADGQIPQGTAVFWQVVGAPPGSLASLDHAASLFPTLAPDEPGDYTLRVEVTAGGATTSADTVVHAYRLTQGSEWDGQWLDIGLIPHPGGTLEGPAGATLAYNGAPLTLAPDGSYGAFQDPIPAGALFHPLVFEVQHPDGTGARLRHTAGAGSSALLAQDTSGSLAVHFNQGGLDQVGQAIGSELAKVDLESKLTSIPTQTLANQTGPFGITLFSAKFKFKGLSFSPNVDVALTPAAGALDCEVVIHNLKVDFEFWGEVVEIDYDADGSAHSDPVEVSADLTLSASGGQVQASIANVSVNLKGYYHSISGFIGSAGELGIIEDYAEDAIEDALEDMIEIDLPPIIEYVLADLPLNANLSGSTGLDVQVEAPISAVQHAAHGVTFTADALAQALSAEPGSPVVTHYRLAPGLPPVFDLLSPTGATYGTGLGLEDDFLNQVLAACTGAGLLEGDPSALLTEPGGAPLNLTAGLLTSLFPGAGFERFPNDAPAGLRTHGTMPPVLGTLPAGPAPLEVELAGVQVVLGVEAPGALLPVLVLALDGVVELQLTATLAGELEATVVSSVLSAQVLRSMPGTSPTVVQSGLDLLTQFVLPTLTGALDGIPVPNLEAQGVGFQPTEFALIGGDSQFLGLFGELVALPPGP